MRPLAIADRDDRLLALGLEVPEDTFVNIHGFHAKGETYGMPRIRSLASTVTNLRSPTVRFMK